MKSFLQDVGEVCGIFFCLHFADKSLHLPWWQGMCLALAYLAMCNRESK